MASGPWVTSWIEQEPVALGERASAATSSARRTVPYGLTGSTRQIARVRGVIAAATRVGVQAEAGGGADAGPSPGTPPAAMTAAGRWK